MESTHTPLHGTKPLGVAKSIAQNMAGGGPNPQPGVGGFTETSLGRGGLGSAFEPGLEVL